MPLFGGVSAAIALASLAYGVDSANKAKRKGQATLDAARAAEVKYDTPQSVKDQLADAQSKNGAINPALLGAYQQALQSQQNQSSFAQRNASSGAQALGVAGEAQSQTQSVLPQLSQLQTNYDQANRANYVDALKSTTEDSRVKQADAAERNQASQQYALGQIGAANANKSQAIGAGVAALGSILNYAGQTQGLNNAGKINPVIPDVSNPIRAQMPSTALPSAGLNTVPLGATQPSISQLQMPQYSSYLPYLKYLSATGY